MKPMSIDERWEKGIPHDPRSISLYEALAAIDFENGDTFQWKSGGDGDNGENLMYLLDIYFEREGVCNGHTHQRGTRNIGSL